METKTKPISEMTKAEIQAYLADQEKADKKAQRELQSEFHQDKNAFIEHSAGKFQQMHRELRDLKEHLLVEANKLYERMYTMKDKEPKDTKSFTLKNEQDTVKITVDRQERFEFTDEAMVHINAIKDIFKEKFAKRNMGMYKIMDGLLIKGGKGEYDPKLLAKARRQVRELGDDNLIAEFDELDECQRVTGTSLYGRCHIRDSKDKWQEITLNFSRL